MHEVKMSLISDASATQTRERVDEALFVSEHCDEEPSHTRLLLANSKNRISKCLGLEPDALKTSQQ